MQRARFGEFREYVARRPLMLFGAVVIVVTFVLALFGPLLVPHPTEIPAGPGLAPPSARFPFGTDAAGLDVFSRVLAAPRIDLVIALVSTIIAFVAGVVLGVLSGFFAGEGRMPNAASFLIMRTAEILQAFPVFIFALALVGFSGPSTRNVITALAFLNIPFFLRLTRSAVLTVRRQTFVEAAVCAGNGRLGVAFRHVMPNSVAPALVHFSTTVGFAILLTAGLSFVGAGVPPPTPEWGLMIQSGAQNMMTGQWWTAVFPGLALGITILGYSTFGDGLRLYLDPTSRG